MKRINTQQKNSISIIPECSGASNNELELILFLIRNAMMKLFMEKLQNDRLVKK